ncbi:hypothetical protein [Algoriphagus confluentis]|uniref:Uncharacterized protein n=1 Tax=Algoriphagus confluentis TaxID=1697556 RepID=A0ABQ6PJF2_9BACT|nr:hypothetical protein Aconfl_07370 [Algoriphagus confluentis]
MWRTWYTELSRRNGLLAKSGALCLLLGAFLLFLPLVDPRELLGQSVWMKPAKFFLSIAIYFWTMGWIMEEVKDSRWVEKISWLTWTLMLIELIIITYQASQGKISHFNNDTSLDGALFGLMGLAITANSLVVIWVLIKLWNAKHLPQGYLWGLRLGLLIFLIAGYQGFLMVSLHQHTVGAADGQEGIPLLGWALNYGDLRVFHFLGIHALQILPLIGWFVFRERPIPILGIAILYFLFCLFFLVLALLGKGLGIG